MRNETRINPVTFPNPPYQLRVNSLGKIPAFDQV